MAFSAARLLTFAEDLGLQLTPAQLADRQQLAAALAASGSTPAQAQQRYMEAQAHRQAAEAVAAQQALAQAQLAAANAQLQLQQQPGPALPPQTNPAPRPPKLAKQETTESADSFLGRATTYFQLNQMDNDQAVTELLNAALPAMATFITEAHTDGVTQLTPLLAALRTRFALAPYQALHQFETYQMGKEQSVGEVAAELRRLYIRFLALPQAQVAAGEAVINKTVLNQVLKVLPGPVAVMARSHLSKDPTITWDVALVDIEAMLLGHRAANSRMGCRNTRPTLGNQGLLDACRLPNHKNHTNAQCYTQARRRQQQQAAGHPENYNTGSA